MGNVLRQYQRSAIDAMDDPARPQVGRQVKFARCLAALGIVHGRIGVCARVGRECDAVDVDRAVGCKRKVQALRIGGVTGEHSCVLINRR